MNLNAWRRLMRRSLLLAASAGAVFAPATAFASPWGRPDGALFVSSRADYFRARGEFIDDGVNATPDLFERLESNTYAELGLTPKVMIGAKAIYGSSWISNEVETRGGTGFSEIEGFIQRTLWRGDNGVAAMRIAGAAPSRFDAGVRPGLKSDGADLELRFLYGRNLMAAPVKIFSAVEIGYRRRFGDAADQIRLDAMAGVEPALRFLFLVETFTTLSARNEAPGGADFDVFKVQPSLVWRATRRCSLQAGVTHEAAGRGLALGDTYFLGLWTEF